jgi:hypothetical protein
MMLLKVIDFLGIDVLGIIYNDVSLTLLVRLNSESISECTSNMIIGMHIISVKKFVTTVAIVPFCIFYKLP